MAKYCKYCGSQLDEKSAFCSNCGAKLEESEETNTSSTPVNAAPEAKSRIAAGVLGIFLGGWGIHNFYLGFNDRAIIQIVVTLVTCGAGALWGVIEGILILCGSINQDANGIPLKD